MLRPPILTAFAVGFWALAGQFIVNRITFFYIANSEYTAAFIISLHLAGFLLGAAFARRVRTSVSLLVATTVVLTFLTEIITWRLGAVVLGLPLTVAAAAAFGFALAALAGAVIMRLMHGGDDRCGQRIIIADSAGSVAGAVAGGFYLLPQWGLQASFVAILFIQSMALLAIVVRFRSPVRAAVSVVFILVVLGASTVPPSAVSHAPRVIEVEGMPIEAKTDDADKLLFSARSPYGLISVIDTEDRRQMNIDGRPLCMTEPRPSPVRIRGLSEWAVGEWPTRLAGSGEGARLATIGLGCGVTMAALLGTAQMSARLDVIELNPEMPRAQRVFDDALPRNQDDPRFRLIMSDGFRYFAEYQGKPYDVVAIDVAWMQNMNATHLFSVEMYRNIRRHLNANGILGVWIEEASPFSPTSLIIYRTLKEVFPYVVADASKGAVVLYASPSRTDMANDLDPLSASASEWMSEASALAPVNRLDNLVMNRTKFAAWGDSTWERLRDKYAVMRATAWETTNSHSSEETDDDITIP